MNKFLPFLTALLAVLFSFADLKAQPISSATRLAPEIMLSVDRVPAGQEFIAVVQMNLQEGWHVNANVPTLDFLIGTELTLEPHNQFIISDIVYPQPKAYEFAFAGGEELLVYEGESPIFIGLRASSNASPGDYIINGTLRVQACDDQTCLAPTNIPIQIPIELVAADESFNAINEDIFSAYDPTMSSAGVAGSQNEIASMFETHGGLWAFVAIFFIGLALNLTPCVYPMLSVTVSIFGAQQDTRTSIVFTKAVTYVLGIATMYSVLGVMAALSGGLFGAWLQSPIVLAVIGILFFLLALSMFGLYELQIPYWLSSKLGSGNSSGFIGTYLSGLVVGIFAAPCIGPPIIALLAFVGTQGDPVFGFWSFFILSLGLGFPYLILGTFTGLIQKMPKSGMWMVWVKKVFGVILVGLALFYVGLAFYPSYVLHLLIITLLIGGIYLGFIEKTGNDKKLFQRVKWVTGSVALVIAFLLFQNLQKPGIEWEMFTQEKYQEALENNELIVLDFYADWCIPCLELERNTFTDPRVIDATLEMTRLKVDLTHFDSPESEELRQEFNIAGVPTIVFLNRDGEEVMDARVVGFMNADRFLERISKVIDSLVLN